MVSARIVLREHRAHQFLGDWVTAPPSNWHVEALWNGSRSAGRRSQSPDRHRLGRAWELELEAGCNSVSEMAQRRSERLQHGSCASQRQLGARPTRPAMTF